MGNWGYREIFKFDGPNLKQLNDTLRALWTKVMGGIDMRDLDNATREVINNKVSSEVVNELGEVVEQHSTQIMQTATDLKALAESIEKVDEVVLKEMEDGSAAFIAGYSYAQVDEFVLSEIGAAAGDEITWSVHVTPERGVLMGLLIKYIDSGGTGSNKWGNLSSVPAEGADLTFTTTAPEDAENIRLNFYLNSPESTKLTVAYRDSVLTKKGSQEYVSRSEFNMTSEEIRAEVSKKATGDSAGNATGVKTASMVINANGVYMTGGEISLATSDGSEYVNVTGEGVSASGINAPNVMPRYAGPASITVNPNATDAQVKAGTHVRSLQSAAALVNGRYLDYDVTIVYANGAVTYGEVEFAGIYGRGNLKIGGKTVGSEPVLYGSMTVRNCGTEVRLNIMTIHADSGVALTIEQTGAVVHVYQCDIRNATGVALLVNIGGRAFVEATALSGLDATTAAQDQANGATAYAAFISPSGMCVLSDTTGKGKLYCQRGVMIAYGTVPSGGAVWVDTFEPNNKSSLTASGTNSGSSAVATSTAEYKMTGSASYAGGWSYFDDDDPRQGYVSGGGRIRGCIWFSSALKTALSGKTIRQAMLRLHQLGSYGRGVSVGVQLYGTSASGASGTPALTKSYGTIGTAEPGQSIELTIPTSVISDLVSGAIGGLMLYSEDAGVYKDRDYSKNYARFSTEDGEQPRLTVVYS